MSFLHFLNDMIGLLLVLIAYGVFVCAKFLERIDKNLECLHNDFDAIHNVHELAKMDAKSEDREE
jgi:hypothetical protein